MQSRLPNFKQLNLGVSNESSQKHLLIRLHIEFESFLKKNLTFFVLMGFLQTISSIIIFSLNKFVLNIKLDMCIKLRHC